jgi:hypothetical protein
MKRQVINLVAALMILLGGSHILTTPSASAQEATLSRSTYAMDACCPNNGGDGECCGDSCETTENGCKASEE